jgi:hypothetical protein
MLLLWLLVLPGPLPATSPSTEALTAADALFSYSEDPAHDLQALALLTRALVADASNYQLLWRAARTYYHVGEQASDREKAQYFARGVEAGQGAVAQWPDGVEGHFWLGANYGGLGEIQGIWQALQLVKQVREEMETALRLQADYEQGGPYRALGELARQLPGLLGGSRKRAMTYFEQGVRVAPQNLGMRFALARTYLEAGQRAAGQRLLADILQTPVRPERARADARTQAKARQLLGGQQ